MGFCLPLKFGRISDTGIICFRIFCRRLREVRWDSGGSKCWVVLSGLLTCVTMGQIMRALIDWLEIMFDDVGIFV